MHNYFSVTKLEKCKEKYSKIKILFTPENLKKILPNVRKS